VSRILVTVGTDHHRFQRLVDWADSFAQRHPEHDVFVQYGTAVAPRHADRSSLLDHSQLQTEIARADVVVCHGGPATITDVRRSGLVPICVPRDPARGEHVDGHQIRFATRIAEAGLVDTCTDVAQLDAAVAAALSRPRTDPAARADAAEGVRVLGARVAELLAGGTPTETAGDGLRILYIGGQGRSGTTLIERALGELPGVVSVGETVHLWDRGLRDNQLCGCGASFRECSFWSQVGEAAFGGWDALDAGEAVDLRFAVDRNRFLPFMARPSLSSNYHRQLQRYLERLGALYRGISEVSGARVILDSSKHASYALLLAQLDDVDLRLLHVVRDSRAVAHAWSKTVARPEADGEMMPVYGPTKTAVLWDLQNAVIERTGRHRGYLRVRYEDFVRMPKDTLLAAATLAGVGDTPDVLTMLDGDTLTLGPSHTVAGNPMRFESGKVTIAADETWRAGMPRVTQRLVGALTLPWQRHYGYGSRTK